MQNSALATILCGGLSLAAAAAHAQGHAPKVGWPHASFTLPSIADRAPVALSQFRGRKVLLIQFASW